MRGRPQPRPATIPAGSSGDSRSRGPPKALRGSRSPALAHDGASKLIPGQSPRLLGCAGARPGAGAVPRSAWHGRRRQCFQRLLRQAAFESRSPPRPAGGCRCALARPSHAIPGPSEGRFSRTPTCPHFTAINTRGCTHSDGSDRSHADRCWVLKPGGGRTAKEPRNRVKTSPTRSWNVVQVSARAHPVAGGKSSSLPGVPEGLRRLLVKCAHPCSLLNTDTLCSPGRRGPRGPAPCAPLCHALPGAWAWPCGGPLCS